ncbi:hypothetical protein XpopCFBP1817_10395 [Xanthomonas populi]|uniref:Insertion element IS402-like domain-containing protein n=1 Tax=Xanthomonas populi TaxID=53414 RepID=A0A2S7EP22_9XANT|nr:hypothetical protein XpopCFBP1817_10395 [Xanthomonas populi]
MSQRVESWQGTDAFWARVEPLIPARAVAAKKIYLRKPGAGRPPPLPARQVFAASVSVLRTGIQWKALPKQRVGSASAIHKRFLEWQSSGFFEALWKAGLAEDEQMAGIAWRWQRVDAAMVQTPMAQGAVGPNPINSRGRTQK